MPGGLRDTGFARQPDPLLGPGVRLASECQARQTAAPARPPRQRRGRKAVSEDTHPPRHADPTGNSELTGAKRRLNTAVAPAQTEVRQARFGQLGDHPTLAQPVVGHQALTPKPGRVQHPDGSGS